jgi:hypothetical protein
VDGKEELARAKRLLGCGAMFLLSCFLVYDEFSYLAWGREAQATVTKAYESRKGGRFGAGGPSELEVDFTFTEADGTQRRGTDTVAPDWPLPRTGTVAVQYTPGELGRARLKGHVQWGGIVFFGVSLAAVAVCGVLLWREAIEAARPEKRGRKRRRERSGVSGGPGG